MPFLAPLIASVGSFLTGLGATIGAVTGLGTAFGSAVVQFGASFLINSAVSAIFGKKPTSQDVSAELAQATTEPSQRFVYGECRATGTPAGTPVKGEYIYGAWILNSRASALPDFKLFFDKREVVLTGDAFNLAGAGATATQDPFSGHCTVWVSRGDQTAPPAAFTTEAAYVEGVRDDLWKATDGWQGRTIIWLKLRAGDSGTRQERWPSTPPLVEVEGKWSRVYDQRTDTTAWTENHALCVRDALMNNPIRQYRSGQIHNSFDAEGPNACDELVSLNAGGTEKRYTCAGTIVWTDGEIEDQLNPLMISGAADFIRVGGKLGYAAGVYREPTETLTYLLGDGFEFPDMLPGSSLVNRLRVTYLSPERGFETAELLPWDIPGAIAEDSGVPAVKTMDLPFCGSATQAMRVRKISGLRIRRQESIEGGTLPPEAFNLVGGSTLNVSLSSPYDALDGVYEVASIYPGLDPIGESGEVAMRMPATLIKHSAAIYAWNPATDEEVVVNEPFNSERQGVQPGGAISVTSGPGVDYDNGGSIQPRFRFSFAPSPSLDVTYYEWQWRLAGQAYQTGGVIASDNLDAFGDLTFLLNVQSVTAAHEVRVRAIAQTSNSDWVELTGAIYNFALSGVSAATGLGNVTVSGTAPSSAAFLGVRIYYGAVGSAFGDATRHVSGITEIAPGDAFSAFAGDPATVNLFSNADFATDTIWTKSAGWSIASGVATNSGASTGAIYQPVTMPTGQSYRIAFEISSYTSGALRPRLLGSVDVNGLNVSGLGLKTETLNVTGPAPTFAGFGVTSPLFTGSIDNATIYQQTALHLPQGTQDVWVVPVTLTKSEGVPTGPFTVTIR